MAADESRCSGDQCLHPLLLLAILLLAGPRSNEEDTHANFLVASVEFHHSIKTELPMRNRSLAVFGILVAVFVFGSRTTWESRAELRDPLFDEKQDRDAIEQASRDFVAAFEKRAAWTVGKTKDRVFEAGIYNLTKAEAPVLVHLGADRSAQMLLVRVEQPKSSQ
jgi:hypothetical protein